MYCPLNRPDCLWDLPSHLFNGCRRGSVFSSTLTRPAREAHLSPSSSVEAEHKFSSCVTQNPLRPPVSTEEDFTLHLHDPRNVCNRYLIEPWPLYAGSNAYRVTQPASCRAQILCIEYTGCNGRKRPEFGRVFLMLNYTEKPQNTYIQSSTVWEIMASEV